jgi:glycosyltransferase involved in cell wall biosynthesis
VAQLSSSVLICTYNRAALLDATLQSFGRIRTGQPWELLIIDNNSADDTRAVVERHQSRLPLRYLFEARQGKSYALNAGLEQSRGEVVIFTDDDVQVPANWIDAAVTPLAERADIDYTGGPVRPMWGAPPPTWLDQTRGDLWGTLAILDYGAEPFVFESRQRIPLGVNMAVRRSLIDRVGGFHPGLGRRGGSLLGQEQAEFFARSRAAGARGLYAPAMELHHHVPAERLTRRYFRRWWFWKGIARSRIDAMYGRTELGLDLTRVPRIARVPRFIWGSLPRAAAAWAAATLRGDARTAARHEMACCYASGYVRACWMRGPLEPLRAVSAAGDPLRAGQEPASVSR